MLAWPVSLGAGGGRGGERLPKKPRSVGAAGEEAGAGLVYPLRFGGAGTPSSASTGRGAVSFGPACKVGRVPAGQVRVVTVKNTSPEVRCVKTAAPGGVLIRKCFIAGA